MTATRDRRSDLDDDHAEPAWDERPIFGSSRGLPWWGAVLLALGLALLAGVIDMEREGSLGRIYQGAYILGCVAAVCLVRRGNLFGPIVQPPLVFAATAISTVIALAPPSAGGGLKSMLLTVALPLTSNFPTMAFTTGGVLVIGLGRLFLQRDPDGDADEDERPRKRPTDDWDDEDDAVARRPRTPRPSAGSEVDAFADAPRRRPSRPSPDDRARTSPDDRPGRPSPDERPSRRPVRPTRDDGSAAPRPQPDDPRARGSRDPNRSRNTGRPADDRAQDRRAFPTRRPRPPRTDD